MLPVVGAMGAARTGTQEAPTAERRTTGHRPDAREQPDDTLDDDSRLRIA